MRINVYAEEMTERVEIVSKEKHGHVYTGLRVYLHTPVTAPDGQKYKGPHIHEGADDSSAVTFWGKQDLRRVLKKALALLDAHYAEREADVCIFGRRDTCVNQARGVRCDRCVKLADQEAKATEDICYFGGRDTCVSKGGNVTKRRCSSCEAAFQADQQAAKSGASASGPNVIEYAPAGAVTLTEAQRADVKRELVALTKLRAMASVVEAAMEKWGSQ